MYTCNNYAKNVNIELQFRRWTKKWSVAIQQSDTVRITVNLEENRELNLAVSDVIEILKQIDDSTDDDRVANDTYIDGLRVIF